MKKNIHLLATCLVSTGLLFMNATASAALCNDISFDQFRTAVQTAYSETNNFGFGLPMWATLMDQAGQICYVYSVRGAAVSPEDNGGVTAGRKAWLGSRVISAQKANTANAFSLNVLAISTGALSVTVYPGGSLYGLQHSNPVDVTIAYRGSASAYGTSADPLVGKRIGGVNVFGGGVGLYNGDGIKVGAVGASGDTSCRDHTLAYRFRIK